MTMQRKDSVTKSCSIVTKFWVLPQNCDLIFSLILSPDNDTIECDYVIEARRPEDIVEKESN